MKRALILAGLLAAAPATQAANNLDTLQNLGQAEFAALSQDLGAALSYKALAPAEPLGITGFDIGIEATFTTPANSAVLDKAMGGNGLSSIPVPKLHAHKGLPFGIDVGLMYSEVPSSNIKLIGYELRYAILEGGVASPALAVRATASNLSGVDQLDLSTQGLELTVSKGFVNLTPYAGIGQVWTTSTPNTSDPLIAAAGLKEETDTLNKYYVGLNVNMGLFNLAFEADKTGDAQTVGAKLGWRF